MNKGKKNNPWLTKKELGLLSGGLLILASVFLLNQESSQVQQTEELIAEKTLSSENPFEEVTFKRKPANKTDVRKLTGTTKNNKNSVEEKLISAENCISSEECALPNTDPRSYSLAAYRKLAYEIESNRSYITNHWSPKFEKKLKHYLSYQNGFVKEAVLKVVLDLEDQDSLNFTDDIIKSVLHDHNTQLMDETLAFIDKIHTPEARAKIETEWVQAIKTGSPNKSEALAKHSHHLLNEDTLPSFKQAMQSLPNESPEKIYLESSIREYEMTQSGG